MEPQGTGGHNGGLGEAHGSWVHPLAQALHVDDRVVIAWIVILFLVLLSVVTTRRLRRDPRGVQNLLEYVIEAFNNFFTQVIGPHGPRYVPLLGTLFLYILSLNLVGLIPGLLSPTASLNMTLALGITTVLIVQYYGIRDNGLKGYIMHFIGEPVWLGFLMLPLHIIGELAKMLSLSIRLFGNIFGEDTIIVQLALFALLVLPKWLPVPLQFPMVLFAIFTSFVQALIFSMLTAIYIAVITAHEEHS